MFALAISGSPRKNGNTAILLNTVLEPLRQTGWETELFELAGKKIRGCLSCGTCMKKCDRHCAVKNDVLHEELFAKMLRADAIVLGSPTYFAGITPEIKAVIDRAGLVAQANGGLFAGKIGAGVVGLSMCTIRSIISFWLVRCSCLARPTGTWATGQRTAKWNLMPRLWPICGIWVVSSAGWVSRFARTWTPSPMPIPS